MAINTECKRKSVFGLAPGSFLLPCPSGDIGASDRAQVLWVYKGLFEVSGLLVAGPENVQNSDDVYLSVAKDLTIQDSEQIQDSSEVFVFQDSTLFGEGSDHLQESDSPTLDQIRYLLIEDSDNRQQSTSTVFKSDVVRSCAEISDRTATCVGIGND